jgi:AcrR family transcriptional regulator
MNPLAGLCRTRNAATTRAAILAAARGRFAEEGYDVATVRAIATDAGIDPALVLRYFGSKEELLAAVLVECGTICDILNGPREEFGARAAKSLLADPVDSDKLTVLQIILRSGSSPKAGPMIRANSQTSFYEPMEAWLGGEDAPIRARALGAIIMGAAMSRGIDDNYGLDDEGDRRKLCERLAEILQRAVD